MENCFPKYEIDIELQKAVFIIKNGSQEDFRRWVAKKTKMSEPFVDKDTTLYWLGKIYSAIDGDREEKERVVHYMQNNAKLAYYGSGKLRKR